MDSIYRKKIESNEKKISMQFLRQFKMAIFRDFLKNAERPTLDEDFEANTNRKFFVDMDFFKLTHIL